MKNPSLAISRSSRRRWTPASDQARWVEAWERGNQTQRAFAEAHGLRVTTLRNWIRRHRGESVQAREVVELREVDLGKLIGPELAGRPIAWEVEIRLPSGVAIAVAPGTAATRVRELAEAVRC